MKKWITGLLVLFIISFSLIYIVIPGNIVVSRSVMISGKINALNRYLSRESEWKKWWPGNSPFTYNGYTYTLNTHFYNRVEVFTRVDGDLQSTGIINIIDLNNNSIALLWEENIATGADPVRRVRQYFFAKSHAKDMAAILSSAKSFLDQKKNVYKADIREVVISDTILISFTTKMPEQPSLSNVYGAINQVRQYILENGAIQTGYPMLNVRDSGNAGYIMMVAVPTNKVLSGNNIFKPKRMPRTRILEAEVRGGPSLISSIFDQMQLYAEDYHLGSSAIPFQSLVTDRLHEQDTSKWVTKLFYPIY